MSYISVTADNGPAVKHSVAVLSYWYSTVYYCPLLCPQQVAWCNHKKSVFLHLFLTLSTLLPCHRLALLSSFTLLFIFSSGRKKFYY